jgi:hypothetical protein
MLDPIYNELADKVAKEFPVWFLRKNSPVYSDLSFSNTVISLSEKSIATLTMLWR